MCLTSLGQIQDYPRRPQGGEDRRPQGYLPMADENLPMADENDLVADEGAPDFLLVEVPE